MLWRSVAQLLLLDVAFAITQTCVGSDGKVVDGYLPCNASATSGTCCKGGEACLDTGLCYGGLGLVYRGACINKWDPATCLTYCEDSGPWANLYPCAFRGSGSQWGPASWWCGPMNTTACEVNTGTFLRIVPGVATTVLPSGTASTTSPSASAPSGSNSATTTSGTTASSSTTLPAEDTPATSSAGRSAAIGLGIGLGVLLLICLVGGFLAMRWYYRQKSRSEATKVIPQSQYYGEMDGGSVWPQPLPQEMEVTKSVLR